MEVRYDRRRFLRSWSAGGLILLAACSGQSSPSRNVPSRSFAGGTRLDLAEMVGGYLPSMRGVRAVIASVDGRTVLEHYVGTTPARTRNAFSVTKSFVSALVGIALADGKLRSVNQTMGETFASRKVPHDMAKVTLRQLLTMTSGLPNTMGVEIDASKLPPDWVAFALHRPLDTSDPGFAYTDVGAFLIGAAVETATGTSLLDYARPRLFDPLGIPTRPASEPVSLPKNQAAYDRADFAWPTDPQHVHLGHGGLKVTPPDLLKFGMLYLDGGRWDGRQLVPEAWVRDSTTAHTPASVFGSAGGYGYEWWITTMAGDPAFSAVGHGGQLVSVVPHRRLVVVVSSDVDEAKGMVVGDDLVLLLAGEIARAI